MLLLPSSAPKKCGALCFVSTGPNSPVVSLMFVSSASVLYIAMPHPAGLFCMLTLLFSGHDPSVYSLISSLFCVCVFGSVSSSLVLSLFHFGSVFCVWLHTSFGVCIAAEAYVFMNSLCSELLVIVVHW